jgi:hypothetical protein
MGLSFRRSKKFGPLRLTFSKRGISTSFGGKYFRVGHSSRGDYVSSSIAGITMRQKLESSEEQIDPSPEPVAPIPQTELATQGIPPTPPKRKVTPGKLFALVAMYLITLYLFSVINADLPPRDFATGRLLLGMYGIIGAIVVTMLVIKLLAQRSKHLDPKE